MVSPIAIVGMACRYPDARSPQELWENVLSQRRAFRRIPPERLRLEDYLSDDRATPDSIYSSEAAVIEGYEFDRVGFRVAGDTFRAADMTHWLALDIAAQALSDGGFESGEGLPRETTAVFLGNTLTGEFSRANVMRLRWPYVRRMVAASLAAEDWPVERREALLKKLEAAYKEPFPAIGEESLAGGLSNTIAGRVCNHFDLKGGGYTVDGACASSLLAIANACSSLAAEDVDVALAGGVDLSIDPFELVGFAKTGALASDMMRVYDARSNGFWPGEGCGFVVLMREADALAQQRRIYATIRGWGISSDGHGGITRPEVGGQLLALQRAYRRAGFGIETVAYLEGHGTGTGVGDATELRALSQARQLAATDIPAAVIGTVKANIGHTKAAAGVAGLIKAALVVNAGVLPPTTGCDEPHAELRGESAALRTLKEGERWPADVARRAGVSAMGFGGINAHVVLEGNTDAPRARAFSNREKTLLASQQDVELFLLAAPDTDDLLRQTEHLLTFAARVSRAELADLAAHLERNLSDADRVRAAIVASSPAELASRLEKLKAVVAGGATRHLDAAAGLFFSSATTTPRIGFLFPGQGSPAHFDGGIARRRFPVVAELYARASLATGDTIATELAQPAIITASLAGLRLLDQLDITATIAVGHSLGELTALHWAGALDEAALLRIARARGKAMASANGVVGVMASIAAGRHEVEKLINGDRVVIAGVNSPSQTILAGEKTAVETVTARARARNLHAVNLPVSHAFHSPLVAASANLLAEHLRQEEFRPVQLPIVSTVTGARLSTETDLSALLQRQITSTVLFMDAIVEATREGVDLWLEVGSGRVLGHLIDELTDAPSVSLDAGGDSLRGLWQAVGAAFALGSTVNHAALFAGRFTRPFSLDWHPKFFVNPCELAPLDDPSATDFVRRSIAVDEREVNVAIAATPDASPSQVSPDTSPSHVSSSTSPLPLIIELVAQRCELPPSAIKHDYRLLSDLHLNSITVSQLVAEAARRLSLPRPVVPTDLADATVAQIAGVLDEQLRAGHSVQTESEELPAGVDSWIRPFTIELVERALSRREKQPVTNGDWQVFAPDGHPLADSLRQSLAECGEGKGVVVCLPPRADEQHVGLLLDGARAVAKDKEDARFVLVQHGGGAAAFARTLHLEMPQVTTAVVDVPEDDPSATRWIVAEALAATRYSEAYYDATGVRREPVWRHLPASDATASQPALDAGDVLVITGGGKGITAECALSIGKSTGARLALIGQASPESDAELANNLQRMTTAGVEWKYYSVDITDEEAVRAAVARIERELGEVTALLHGAARNKPQLLGSHQEEFFKRTLAVKVGGARNLLAAVNPDKLRLFIAFGSIIARTGLPGESDYGLANEWLTRLAEEWQTAHPHCRCMSIEWSVWAGVGMGERLASLEVLRQQGIVPIPSEAGVAMLHELLARPLPVVPVVVAGRYGTMPTFQIEPRELPFMRFLERPRVYYPGIELVADVDLSTDADPYLDDHQLQGERLLPAVIGLEAMAQVAAALDGGTAKPSIFENVFFHQPVVVPESSPLTIRVAAIARRDGVVEVALRSEETAFQADHFKATCRFQEVDEDAPTALPRNFEAAFDNESLVGRTTRRVALEPLRDLYGDILFHGGRFRLLSGYRLLKATECLAEIAPDQDAAWFSPYLPGTFLLGSPARRDAAIHAIQACIPHATVLPVGVDRITFFTTEPSPEPLFVYARERERAGNVFTYDMQVLTAEGIVRERWEGLRLRMVVNAAPRKKLWIESLLAPYVERRVGELVAGAPELSIALRREPCLQRRTECSDAVIQMALGARVTILRRVDGKPEAADGRHVSASHCGDLTLAAASGGAVGCDVEQVTGRSDTVWRELLGDGRFALAQLVARSSNEDEAASRTRAWAASECLKKAGAAFDAPLMYLSSSPDGWVLLSSGKLAIATYVTGMRESDERLAFAVLVESAT